MKTALKLTLVVFLLLGVIALVFRYLLFPIVPTEHLYDRIPASADQVLTIDTEEMLSMTLGDVFTDPSDGFPFEKDEDEEDEDVDRFGLSEVLKKGIWHGIQIPDRLIAYRDGEASGLYALLLPMDDPTGFSEFLRNGTTNDLSGLSRSPSTEIEIWNDSTYSVEVGTDHLRILFGDVAGSSVSSAAAGQWSSTMAGSKNRLDIEGVIAEAFTRTRDSSMTTVSVHSSKGLLRLDLTSGSTLPLIPRAGFDDAEAWISFIYGPDEEQRHRAMRGGPLAKTLDQMSLDPLALDTLWDGTVDLCIHGAEPTQKEIVTYSYDDDFNKVEERRTVDQWQGNFIASIGLSRPTDSLFYERGWVKSVDGRDVFVNYPIQEVYYREESGRIILSSSPDMELLSGSTSTDGRLSEIDLKAVLEEYNATADSLRLDLGLSRLTTTLQADGRNLSLEILMDNDDRQGIMSFLEVIDRFD